MNMDRNFSAELIEAVANTVLAHEEELTALDSAIGDGDHGINMKRGFKAVLDDIDTLASQPLGEGIAAAGMVLVMKVGGASGPLFGSAFMALGKALGPAPDAARAVKAFSAAIEAVKLRGKSDAGAKTMLDVLVPVHEALCAGETDFERLRQIAREAAEATVPMLATRGRASFLGERSIGHMDPGARSTALILTVVLDLIERGQEPGS